MVVKIQSIEYLKFSIGSYHSEYRHFIFEDGFFTYKETQFDMETEINPIGYLDKDFYIKLIEILNKTQFTNWQRKYEDVNIVDGTEWKLEVKYNNRKTSKITFGYNQFPLIIEKDGTNKIIDCEKDFFKMMKLFNQIIKRKLYFH
ncbi:hypothetical protein [Cloacibacterium sp.]|uniref:hypothetical protein n=1 Tax=Cloacibacterium sp. TaxID=1913682 RepID=UPI0039E46296